jgi:hypothetical protein
MAHFQQFCAASIALLGLSVGSARGSILDLVFGGSPRSDGGKMVGISLTSFGKTFTSLGFYDHNQDGIAATYQLGLWDASQNLLATTTVSPSSPLIGQFRYGVIPAVTIGTFANPQPFTIGVLLQPVQTDVWLDSATLALYAGYAGAGTGQFLNSGTLAYPTTLDASNYFVVNANGIVPEPATVALVAAGAGAMLGRRRR